MSVPVLQTFGRIYVRPDSVRIGIRKYRLDSFAWSSAPPTVWIRESRSFGLVVNTPPDTGDIREVGHAIHVSDFSSSLATASPRIQLDAAVAEYAEILRESYWAQGSNLRGVRILAQRVSSLIPYDPDVIEFVHLVTQAERIANRDAR